MVYKVYVLYSPIEVAGKKDLIHKIVTVGIIFLFIITSVTPMAIGYTSDDVSSESEELLDNLAFMCYDGKGDNDRYKYYITKNN